MIPILITPALDAAVNNLAAVLVADAPAILGEPTALDGEATRDALREAVEAILDARLP